MEIPATVLLYAVVGILAVILVVWLFRKPLKWIFKLLLNALIGYGETIFIGSEKDR